LLIPNALTPPLGAVSAVVGAGLGLLIGWLIPAGRGEDGVVLVAAALLFAGASALALRLGRDQLGPVGRAAPLANELRATVTDLVDGARYLVRRRTPGLGLGVMAVHRFLYGANFIALILISRNLLADPADADAGLATFGLLTGISFAGNGLAILLTPLAHERMTPATWILVCLGLGAVSQVVLTTTPTFGVVAASAVLLGLAVQGAKIAVDTIVQRDTHDDYRGRAFSLYDMLYNAAFVAAAALAAVALPDTGWSRGVFAGIAVAYVLAAVGYRVGTVRAGAAAGTFVPEPDDGARPR
ncbi:MFS transporter, partial [Actinotalea sp. C106]|uniref:MFS transporter n=1 Tax=Actinotalea sp. C106 TaxID=2908644 RepID=UPI002029647F